MPSLPSTPSPLSTGAHIFVSVWSALAFVALATVAVGGCKHKEIPSDPPATGVAACDAYVERYEACIDNMPENARIRQAPSIDAQRRTFREVAATAEGRAQMATQCAAASQALPACP